MIIQSRWWNRDKLFFGIVFILTLIVCGVSQASSFPFRSISPGDPIPSLSFTRLSDGTALATDSISGSPTALVFWGADIETKKERSQEAFAALEKILPFLQERKIKVMLINAQGDAKEIIESTVNGLTDGLPVYIDENQKAYGELGIFIVPSVLLIDKDGKVVTGLGYSHDFSDRLKGEIQIMLGEKTREEVEKELRPEMVEKSATEKQITRHLNTAEVMVKRGQIDSAISELMKALEINPELGEAHGQLGCLYLDKGKLAEAKAELDKSYEINPEYLPANICDARVLAEEGDVEVAIGDLKALLFRNARNPDLHFVLGTLYEKQQKFDEAAAEYRKAYELVSKHVEY